MSSKLMKNTKNPMENKLFSVASKGELIKMQKTTKKIQYFVRTCDMKTNGF